MSAPPVLGDRLALVVIVDPEAAPEESLLEIARAALQAGAPALQLRAKRLAARRMLELSRALLRETRRAEALLFVNDRVDVALAAGADGAHLGEDDLPLAAARAIVPPGFLLGRSVDDVQTALHAVAEGADYLGAGSVYLTTSKADAGAPIGTRGVAAIAAAVDVPLVGIGGITTANAREVAAAGAAGVAVIKAVSAAADPAAAAAALLAEVAAGRSGAS